VNLGIDAIHAYLEGNGNSFEMTLQRTFKDHLGFVLAKKNKIVLRIYISPSALRHQSVTSPAPDSFNIRRRGQNLSQLFQHWIYWDGSGWFTLYRVLEMTPSICGIFSFGFKSGPPSRATSLPPRDFGCLLGTRFMCCRLKVNAMVRECRPFRGSVIPATTDSDARKAEHGDSARFNGINTVI
jgi:hypothetical protein